MASEDPMNYTAETEEETVAQRRKRLRRVSFADREITSVHIFKRDEDYETPPNSSASKPQNGEQGDASGSEDKAIRFFGELADNEDTEGDGDGDDDEVGVEKLFLRPKGSPSSGGSTFGSAKSDDDDFFGPVSSHFINPGRLSDAAISEDHHDITMDSTAFSMHFRSLAMSESGDVNTSTSSHHRVEENTPIQATSTSDTGSAMVLTYPKKVFPKSPIPVDKDSGGRDSNDMSIVGEHSHKYDYGYISPTLAALLGDDSKKWPPESPDNSVKAMSPLHKFSLSPANESQRYSEETPLTSSTRMQSASFVGVLPQAVSCITPSPKQGGTLMSRETLAILESLSTIQKSKSRLGLIPSSPGSALLERIENSKLKLSGHRPVTTPSTIGREDIGVCREKQADIPITNLENLLSKDDNTTPVSESKGIPDQHSCGALSPVNSTDLFVCISSKGNTNSEIEGSLLKQQEINQTASTPEKFVSPLANSPNLMKLEPKNIVTLHDQEQYSKSIGESETMDGNVAIDGATNYSMIKLSDKVDSLLAESSVLLNKTGFFDGSVQQIETDSMLNENQNRTNISAVHSETEVISTEDFPAVVVTEDLRDISGSSSVDRTENKASHTKGSSGLKRKAKDADCTARNLSPKVRKNAQEIIIPVMDQPDGNYAANECGVVRKQVINSVEIPGKVSVEINQMLAPMADKLNSRLIYKLEDMLTYLKKGYLFEMLCLQIKSQKIRDDFSGVKTKRRAESRSLLCKLAYEKAKLELLHLKQVIMMKKSQTVNAGVEKTEILRLNCEKLLRQHGFHSTELLNPEQAHEVTTSKGAEKTQEIEVLDSKIKDLVQCFPTHDNMTEEPAYADTIKTAEDNLKKKMSCRFIRQEILVWKVDSLGEKNDDQSIVLNYSDLINQRLTLKPGRDSCVLISNSLGDTFIKCFPDMNVSIAFNSLFNAEYSREYVGSITLLEITQKTSLVLHNLLDVAEEFQLATMEIPNLLQGKFDSPSAEKLHLQISFIDCINLRKVDLILDLSCLIHGKYPGDILPCEIVEVSGTNKDSVMSKKLMDEIESAMDDVGVGYPRILKICRCISKLLQSQNRR